MPASVLSKVREVSVWRVLWDFGTLAETQWNIWQRKQVRERFSPSGNVAICGQGFTNFKPGLE
jgi:hypothetical protein